MSAPHMGARILGRTGEAAGITWEFTDTVSLGRSAGNDIVINSPFLSGQHARIYFQKGEFWIEDLGSRNGTRIDGVAVSRPLRLERVHVITLADAVDVVYVRKTDLLESAWAPADSAGDADASQPVATPPPGPDSVPGRAIQTHYEMQFEPLVDPRAASPVAPDAQVLDPAPPATPPGPPVSEPTFGKTMISPVDEAPIFDPRSVSPPGPAEPEPAPIPVYELILELPDGSSTVYTLKPGENVLGRAEDCDVTVPDTDKLLSRRHATLTVEPDCVRLADRDTLNGTFVGGARIQAATIEPGTTFTLGPNIELMLIRR